MCPGPEVHSPCAVAESDLKWRLEEEGSSWRFTVCVTGKPNVDLKPEALRLEREGAEAVVLPVPPEAQPVDLAAARVSFSSKRRELVVKWPRKAGSEQGDAAPEASKPREQVHGATSSEASTEDPSEASSSSDESPASGETSNAAALEVPAAPADASPDAFPQEKLDAHTTPGELSTSVDASCPEESEVSAAAPDTPVATPSRSAEEWKALGNEAVKAADYAAALDSYSAGLAVEPDHAILLSNRTLCLHKLGRLEDALVDAKRCVALRPDFFKAFLRGALVLRELGRPQEALELLRKAPLHEEVEKLSAEVKPEAEAAEERRIAALGGAERKKEEGNLLFKKGLFEQALPVYNEALALCSDPVGELALAIRNNRAGCYHQLSNFESVVEDSTFVLEQQPDNFKALMRRMIALEPLEKYEAALRDARAVLRLAPSNDAANRLQHRLSKLVRDRERERNSA